MTKEEMTKTIQTQTSEELMKWYDEAQRVNVFTEEKPWGLEKLDFMWLRSEMRNEIIKRMSK